MSDTSSRCQNEKHENLPLNNAHFQVACHALFIKGEDARISRMNSE